ncbi:hypothetical protein ACLBWS_17155 [Brucellaceae bacterium D45D]
MPEHLFVRFGGEGQGATDKNAMLQRIRAYDWMQSPLGPIENWPILPWHKIIAIGNENMWSTG